MDVDEHFAVFSKDISCKSEGHIITKLKQKLRCSCYGNIVIPSTNKGIHQWTFLIGSTVQKSKIAIGIDEHNCAGVNDNFYQQKTSSGIVSNVAYVSDTNLSVIYMNGVCEQWYGTAFHADDVITMILDLSKRSLHFLVNGNDNGTAAKKIRSIKDIKYRMAVSLSLPGDSISLLSYSYIPIDENIDDNKDNESKETILMKKYEELQITSSQHITEVNNKLNNMTDVQQQLIAQIDKYMQENEHLKKENNRMASELNSHKSQITQLQTHCNNLVNESKIVQKEKNDNQQLLQKNEELLSQLNLMKAELDTTKNENIDLKTKLEQASTEYSLKLAENTSKYNQLRKLNIEMQNNLLNVNDDYKEMSVKYNQLLKQQQQRILNDTRNYKQWDHSNIADWICNVESKRFKQYEQQLRVKLKDEGITGMDIGDLDKNDLHRIGITNFGDKKALLKHIQHLIAKSSQNNEIDVHEEGIGTAFI